MSLAVMPDLPLLQIFKHLDIESAGLMTRTCISYFNFVKQNDIFLVVRKNLHKITITVIGNGEEEFSENIHENAIEVRVEMNRQATKVFVFYPNPDSEKSKDDYKTAYEDEENVRIFEALPSSDFLNWLSGVVSNSSIDTMQIHGLCLNENELESLESLMQKRKTKTGLLLLVDYFGLEWKPSLLLRFLKLMNVTSTVVDGCTNSNERTRTSMKALGDFIFSHGIRFQSLRWLSSFNRAALTTSFDELDRANVRLEERKRMEFSQIKEKLHEWARGRATLPNLFTVDICGPYRSARTILEDLKWPADLHSELTSPLADVGSITNIHNIECTFEPFSLPHKPFKNIWNFMLLHPPQFVRRI